MINALQKLSILLYFNTNYKMGNGFCNCSEGSNNGSDQKYEMEAKGDFQQSVSPEIDDLQYLNDTENDDNLSQDINKRNNSEPIKQNKSIDKDYNYVVPSQHNIKGFVDSHAAKAHHSDDSLSEEELDTDLDSITGSTLQLDDTIKRKRKPENKGLLRYASRRKVKWNDAALDEHENEMLQEIRRLSLSHGITSDK